LGYPAILLLFCVVDRPWRILGPGQANEIPNGEPFFVPNHLCFGLPLTKDQVKRLERWYRNGLAHNVALPPGTGLTGEDGPPCEFAANGIPGVSRLLAASEMGSGCYVYKLLNKMIWLNPHLTNCDSQIISSY
jgi:hypothetical protein